MAKDTQLARKRQRSTDQHTVLKKKRYRGQVTVGGQSVDVRFTLSAKADCRLRFKFDAMDGRSFMILAKTMGKPGQPSERFVLDARTKGGDRISSDSLSMAGYQVGDGGHFVEVSYLTAKVVQVMKAKTPKPILRLWFRGFSSFRNLPIETRLGPWLFGVPRRASRRMRCPVA